MSDIKHIGVMTSGGDSAGMNPCIRSVVRTSLYNGFQVTGILHGYQGLIDGEFVEMKSSSVSGIINRGGTILYTARCEEFKTPEGRQKAHDNIKSLGLDALVVIGGDGSYTGAEELFREFNFPVVCCPGTIDNDITGTEYTLGYDTALNVAMEAIDKIRDTAASHGRLFIVEVMGRHAGYVALEAGIAAGAEEILIPETKSDVDFVIEKLRRGRAKGKLSSIVVVAEGDDTGGALKVAEKIEGQTGYNMRVTILGHMQRGGAPTALERLMASRFGYFAIEALKFRRFGTSVGIMNGNITYTPLRDAIQKYPRIKDTDLQMVQALSY